MSREFIASETRWSKRTRHAALGALLLFVAAALAYSARLLGERSYFWFVGISLATYVAGLVAAERSD
jgi:hypothetical protein